jgi:hypothetical protein
MPHDMIGSEIGHEFLALVIAFLLLKRRANAIASARSLRSAGVSLPSMVLD